MQVQFYGESGKHFVTYNGTISEPKTDDILSKFGYYMLYQKNINKICGGSGLPFLSYEQLNKIEVCYPKNIQEQEAISNYLTNLDNLIDLYQNKYEKLVSLKKALLEKMFPKNDENVPKIRFKGFNDTWRQCKLDEIVDRYDNLRVPVTAKLRKKGNTPYYGANGIQDYVKGYTHKGEFILVAEDGANDLKNYPVQYVNGCIWANNHVHVLQAKKEKSDNKFLVYAISQTDIESLLVGGGRAKLNANIMMEIKIKLPNSLEEQSKIGNLILNVDNLITLHKHKLDKLQNIKKSLLNKMFV